MKLKKIILCFLALCILVCTCGCALGLEEIERDGVEYEKHNNDTGEFWRVSSVGCGYEVPDTVYIPDEIDGIPVIGVGFAQWGGGRAKIWRAERVYFPWSIERSLEGRIGYSSEVKYIISASTDTLIDNRYSPIFVIPKYLYNNYMTFDYSIGEFTKTDLTGHSNIIPANIAYLFNYEENPNEGYFFVDLLEESGKIVKPPYDPKRDGYKFAGWYKEAECVNAWDFENDIVEINFDEEGERIYEEFCLYAKWEKK